MALSADQERVLADIRKYGCHVIQVQGNGPHPSFAYSVGIGRTSDSPDVCVFGLPAPSASTHVTPRSFNARSVSPRATADSWICPAGRREPSQPANRPPMAPTPTTATF